MGETSGGEVDSQERVSEGTLSASVTFYDETFQSSKIQVTVIITVV